jgi:hypothetical protein
MNQTSKQFRICLGELPARPRKLNPSETSALFGGYIGDGQPCIKGETPCCGNSNHGCWTTFSKYGTCGTGDDLGSVY